MVDVVAIHGISQQQGGRLQLLEPWQLALGDGIERARGRGFPKPSMDLVYYGDLFLSASGTSKGKGALELDSDEIAFLEAVQDEVVPDDEEEPETLSPKGVKGVPKPVSKLANWVERHFGVAGRLLFFGDLVQVRRYQRDDELANAVHDRIREALAESPYIMVGHSLGSLIAYEALCVIPDHGITTLVTIGSPLGLRSLRESLRPDARRTGLPPGVQNWVNIYDSKDPVALAGPLQPYWPDVVDSIVDNGNDPHAATRYLGKQATGATIADSLAST